MCWAVDQGTTCKPFPVPYIFFCAMLTPDIGTHDHQFSNNDPDSSGIEDLVALICRWGAPISETTYKRKQYLYMSERV